MNVITYDRAVSLYPLATFEIRTNEAMSHYGTSLKSVEGAQEAMVKYAARGFDRGIGRSAEDYRALFQYSCERKVGDRWSWTIYFDMDNITAREWIEHAPWEYDGESGEVPVVPQSAQDPIMENKWRLSGAHVGVSPKYCLLRLPIFRYAYAVASGLEAVRARRFSDEMGVWKSKGGCADMTW